VYTYCTRRLFFWDFSKVRKYFRTKVLSYFSTFEGRLHRYVYCTVHFYTTVCFLVWGGFTIIGLQHKGYNFYLRTKVQRTEVLSYEGTKVQRTSGSIIFPEIEYFRTEVRKYFRKYTYCYSSDEMHYPLDDAVGGLQGMPREFFQRLPVAFSR